MSGPIFQEWVHEHHWTGQATITRGQTKNDPGLDPVRCSRTDVAAPDGTDMKTLTTIARFCETTAVLALSVVPFPTAAAQGEDTLKPAVEASAPPKPHFGPVTEVILSSDAGGENCLLDLETGRVMSPTPALTPDELLKAKPRLTVQSCETAWRTYLSGLGVDILNEDYVAGLSGCDLAVEPVDTRTWDLISPAELFAKVDGIWRDPKPLSRCTFGPRRPGAQPPHTFVFRTREGNRGILQITNIQRQPKRVKVRYKLVTMSKELTNGAASSRPSESR